jgi:hypothetical protein
MLRLALKYSTLHFLWQDYGASCVAPVFSGVTSAADKQTIVDKHNKLRRRVALGLETLGNPGPQPGAANMREIVSTILLKIGIMTDITMRSEKNHKSNLKRVIYLILILRPITGPQLHLEPDVL